MNERFPIDDSLLAARLRALAHPARLAVVRALAAQDRCLCGEIVEALPLAQSTVSQHLKVLKDAGLIDGAVEGPRSCYRLDREALGRVAAALAALPEAAGPLGRPTSGLEFAAIDPMCTPAGAEPCPAGPQPVVNRGST